MFCQYVLCRSIENCVLNKIVRLALLFLYTFPSFSIPLKWSVQSTEKENIRQILLFAFNRGANATEAARGLREVYGDKPMPCRMVQKWFKRFKFGNGSRNYLIRISQSSCQIRTKQVGDMTLFCKMTTSAHTSPI